MSHRSSQKPDAGDRAAVAGVIFRYTAVAVIAGLGAMMVTDGAWRSARGGREALVVVAPGRASANTVAGLAAMSDAELAKVDPLVMNLVVAREVPEFGTIDIAKYAALVDGWAKQINQANRAAEPYSKDEPAYKADRRVWMAGGMATVLAGPRFGVRYTKESLDPRRPEQTFVCGLIDTKTGTCASMPVLYMAIGHRLGWPIRGVVSKDHMWARWDDGVPASKGGARFNLEATTASSDGGEGSFATPPDSDYVRGLGIPEIAVTSGSDLTTLTPRQTLGVFLQGRAGYWAAHEEWRKAELDLLLAVQLFPQNRDIRSFLVTAIAHVNGRMFTNDERGTLASEMSQPSPFGGRSALAAGKRGPLDVDLSRMAARDRRRAGSSFDVDAINRENAAIMQRMRDEATKAPRPWQPWLEFNQPGTQGTGGPGVTSGPFGPYEPGR